MLSTVSRSTRSSQIWLLASRSYSAKTEGENGKYTYLPPGCSVSDPLYKISTNEPVYFYDKPSAPGSTYKPKASTPPPKKDEKVSPLSGFVEFTTKLRGTSSSRSSAAGGSLDNFVQFTSKLREASSANSKSRDGNKSSYVYVPVGRNLTSVKEPKYFGSLGESSYGLESRS